MNEEKKHPVNIIVNGRQELTNEKKISYTEVLALAFGQINKDECSDYTVTYSRGHSNTQGLLLPGKEVPVKEGMVFNATKTTRS